MIIRSMILLAAALTTVLCDEPRAAGSDSLTPELATYLTTLPQG